MIWPECVDIKGKFQGSGKTRATGRVEGIHLALIQQHFNFGETLYPSSISVALTGSNPGNLSIQLIFSCSSVISAASRTRCVEEFLEEEITDNCFGIIFIVYDYTIFHFTAYFFSNTFRNIILASLPPTRHVTHNHWVSTFRINSKPIKSAILP